MAENQKKNKFPISNIRVGYQNISVNICSDEDERELEDNEGFYLSCKSAIYINDKQCFSEQVATLFHESLHAIFFTYGMKEIVTDRKKEEYIVNTMSNAILRLIQENPKLIDLIKNAKK